MVLVQMGIYYLGSPSTNKRCGAGNLILFCGITFTGISNLTILLNLAVFSESIFIGYRRNTCSVAMEKEGLRRSLNYLLEQDVSINTVGINENRLSLHYPLV